MLTPIDNRKIRIAVLGCGRISKNHFGAIEKHRDRLELVAVCDTNPVAGFLAALDSDRGVGEVINIGSSFEISIGDTAATIAEVMGAEIEILTDAQRLRPEKSEVDRLFADLRARMPRPVGLKSDPHGLGFSLWVGLQSDETLQSQLTLISG